MPKSALQLPMDRRRVLLSAGAHALAVGGGMAPLLSPSRLTARTIHRSGNLEVLIVSDGYFSLPTTVLVAADAPAAERNAALRASGQSGERLQLVNNVAVIRGAADVVLIDAGAGPRHQPTSGKLVENLKAVGIAPAEITKILLTHCHPDHLGGVLDARDNPLFPNARYFVSASELELWADPDVMEKLPKGLLRDVVVKVAKNHLARIKDEVTTVRNSDEIIAGVQVVGTPGHTQGHISVEVAGGDGLLIAGDAITHIGLSFMHPTWRVPADHDGEQGVATRLRLLDRLAGTKMRLACAHLPYPGVGFVERKDGIYRFVAER